MAGDKGAEALKPLQEYLKKPSGVKEPPANYYSKRGEHSPALKEALVRLQGSIARRKQRSGEQNSDATQNNLRPSREGGEYQTMPGADEKIKETFEQYNQEAKGSSEDKTRQTED